MKSSQYIVFLLERDSLVAYVNCMLPLILDKIYTFSLSLHLGTSHVRGEEAPSSCNSTAAQLATNT